MKKLIIGLTTELYEDKAITNYDYIKAIRKVGAIPVLLPLSQELDVFDAPLDILDGILFIGGEDILPEFYNQRPHKNIGEISICRDSYEIKLFKKAYEKNIPIFGVCRGLQLANVALGGQLYQDIYDEIKTVMNHSSESTMAYGFHNINIEKESFLYEIYNQEQIFVNSTHHQAIKTLGKNLKISAKAPDGIIEAVESTNQENILYAVQFHPEKMIEKRKEIEKIFQFYIDKIQERKKVEE